MAKTTCWIQHTKRIEAEKNGDEDGKVLYKLMNNALYGKTMKNIRNRIDVKFVSNKKKLFKMDIQTKLYVTKNIWQWLSCDTEKQSCIIP